MTIGKKLIACFGGMLAFTLILGYTSMRAVNRTQDLLRSAIERDVKELDLVGQIQNSTTTMRFAQRGVVLYSMSGDTARADKNRKDFLTERDEVQGRLQSLKTMVASEQGQRAVTDMQSILAKYSESFEQISKASAGKQFDAALDDLKAAGPLGKEMDQNADALTGSIRDGLQLSAKNAERAGFRATVAIWSGIAATIGIAGVVLFFVVGINKNLRIFAAELTEGSNQIKTASNQVSTSSQGLAQSASEEAAGVQDVADSADTIAKSSGKNAHQAGEAKALMARTEKIGGDVKAAVDAMGESIAAMSESGKE